MFKLIENGDDCTIQIGVDRIDLHLSAEFKGHLETSLEKSPSSITIECGKVNYLDSAMIGLLVHYQKKAKDSGIQFILQNITDSMNKMLEITKLLPIFTIK